MKTIRLISLFAAVLLLLFSAQSVSADDFLIKKQSKKIKISGVVTDANTKPIGGVLIFVDQVFTTTTNAKGIYRVQVAPTAKQILAFSRLYGVQKIEIKSDLTAFRNVIIDITLVGINANMSDPLRKEYEMINSQITEPIQKDDEIFSIGYGMVSKRNLNAEVDKIEGQDYYHSYSNVYDMIRGRFPGVEVTGNSIKIRGSSSLYVSTEPTFVVDGVIVNSIDHITPQNIKSIEVLKGSAATVYGMRGSNGVIVITRLTGKD